MSASPKQREPDRADIAAFVDALFRYADVGTYVSLRIFRQFPDGRALPIVRGVLVDHTGLDAVNDSAVAAAGFAANDAEPLVFCPPIATFTNDSKATEEALACGLAISAELDRGNTRKAREQLERLLGPATVVVESGGTWIDPVTGEEFPKLHLHWRLSEPTRDPEEHAKLKLARRLAGALVEGDATASTPVHPMRWPGSWHLKDTPRLARIVTLRPDAEVHLHDAIDALEDAASVAGMAPPDADTRHASGEPQADISLIASAMTAIPNEDESWDIWNAHGMALFRATGGSVEGLNIWLAWSTKSASKHRSGICESRWAHFRRSPPTQIGAGSIIFHAKAAGWVDPREPRIFRMAGIGDGHAGQVGPPSPPPREDSTANDNNTGCTDGADADDGWGDVAGGMPPPDRDAKRPLFRPLPDAPDFPVHALGPLREPAEALQMRTQAPLALCAQSALAAATLAIQAHRDVELPSVGMKPVTGIFASVADSGERKTTVDRIALAAVYQAEQQWRETHEADIANYQNDHDAWDAARKDVVKRNKGNRAAIKTQLDALGPEPKPPPQPMLLISDPTSQALVLHLQASRPWGGLFTSEGGILLGGAAFTDDNRLGTGALLNLLWDGEPIRRVRVGTGSAYLPGRRCSAHVMMQPAVAHRLFGDPMLDGIGLLSRVLVVAPDSTAGTRLFRQPPPECRTVLNRYNDRVTIYLHKPPRFMSGTSDVLDPVPMVLAPAARQAWIAFHDAVERDLVDEGILRPIRPFGAKMAEHAARLAALLSAYADPNTTKIDATSMACGITLVQHYAAELIRLLGTGAVNQDLRLADRLLKWWQMRSDPCCHLAMIYQRSLNAIGDAATARRIVGILEDHGWVERLPKGTVVDGAPRNEAWALIP